MKAIQGKKENVQTEVQSFLSLLLKSGDARNLLEVHLPASYS